MLEFLLISLFLSVPEAFVKLYFSLKLITPSFSINKRNMTIYVLLIAFISNVLWKTGLEIEVIFIVMLILSVIFCKFIIGVKWSLALTLTFISYAFQIFGEFIILFIINSIFGFQFEDVHESLMLKIFIPYLYLIPLFLFALYLKSYQQKTFFQSWLNAKYKLVLPLILLQLIFGLAIHALYLIPNNHPFSTIFIEFPILTFAMIIVTFIILIYIEKLHEKEVEKNIQYAERPLIEEMDKLMKQWRKYRHDFHNHIEVLYGLLEEKNYSEATAYMENLHKTIIDNQTKFNLNQPAVQALINAKTMQAEQHNIRIHFESKEKVFFPHLKSYDVVLILGNILDNAIHALSISNQSEKIITITYKKVINILVLEIANNGPMIPNELHLKIFEHGFTTKTKSENSGNGLAIVKDIVQGYQGEINVFSNDNQTIFQIAFPI